MITSIFFLDQAPMGSDIVEVIDLAFRLRRAMETADFTDCPRQLHCFPHECCDLTCSLLLVLFHEAGIDGFCLVKGKRPGGKTRECGHVWVQRGDTVVDITADQFEGTNNPSVIVGRSVWHATLEGVAESDALDFDISYVKQVTPTYERVYATGHLPVRLRQE